MNNEFNIVIHNDNFLKNEDLIKPLFNGEEVRTVPAVDMFDVLVFCGIFSSKGQARKNWKKTGQEIPPGFTDIKGIGKLRKRLTIWSPIG